MRIVLLVAVVLLTGFHAAYSQAPVPRKPLSKLEVADLLRNAVPPRRVEELARQYGIAFELTPEVERDLAAAGADGPLIAALRELSPKPASKPAAPAEAVLLIESSPGGVQVYLDDESFGTASEQGRLKIPRLKAGGHLLRLSLAGHQDFEQKITLEGGETARIFAKLEPLGPAEPKSTAPSRKTAEPSPSQTLDQQSDQFERIVQSVAPAVVNLVAQLPGGRQSLGSGVIISSDGNVLTNRHIVAGATDLSVTLADQRFLKARILGTDDMTDMALLRVEGSNLPVATWGDSSALRPGAIVLAIGNPVARGPTVSRGVVSAAGGSAGAGLEDGFIQTDATINPGNSGGPLVNVRGEVVGICTAIVATPAAAQDGGGASRIGFAIPSNAARRVAESLRTMGRVQRGYVGIAISNLSPAIARQFGYPQDSGALINDVVQGAPGENAGLKAGDIIHTCNGAAVATADQFRASVANQAPGSSLALAVWRAGRTFSTTLVLAERPAGTDSSSLSAGLEGAKPDLFTEFFGRQPQTRRSDPHVTRGTLRGIYVRLPQAKAQQRLGLPADMAGLFVTGVEPDSPAAKVGLQQGDVIESIGQRPMRSEDDFESLAERATGDVLLHVRRGRSAFFVLVSPGAR
ncbi:MAG: trypsin-like peptidase domain-containing protein [Acidobacteriia bacterium]|nr:trypsin-like peptidase domain-containing protein [Terriglobia bacterium]